MRAKVEIHPQAEEFSKSLLGKSEVTIKSYAKQITYFLDWLELQSFDITSPDIDMFLSAPNSNGEIKSARTINLQVAALKKFGKWLRKKKRIVTDLDLLEATKVRPCTVVTLPNKVLKKLISEAKKEKSNSAALIELLATRGLRTVEIVRLKLADLVHDKENKCYYLNVLGKGKVEESEKLSVLINKALYSKILKHQGEVYLFENYKGKQIDTSYIRRIVKDKVREAVSNFTPDQLRKDLDVIARKLGKTPEKTTTSDIVTNFHAHAFRHTLASICAANNVHTYGADGNKLGGSARLLRHVSAFQDITSVYNGEEAENTRRKNHKDSVENKLDEILKTIK